MATVTVAEVHSYHRIDRELYSQLVINLCRDPFRSIDIIAFWMCLEHVGFPNIVLKLMKLPDHVVDTVADEAILIFSCITSKTPPPESKNMNVIPLTRSLMDNKDFSLSFLYENRSYVISGITQKVNEVCIKGFYDILQKAVANNPTFLRQCTGYLIFGADRYRSELSAKNVLKEERRSIVVTFSRGSPMSDRDLMEYFVGLYGNCIERVHQQERKQPQYARVVFHSASTIKTFLDGQEKVKFAINGKQLCARRYQAK